MKNTLTKLLPAVLLLLAVALSGCEKISNIVQNDELSGISWVVMHYSLGTENKITEVATLCYFINGDSTVDNNAYKKLYYYNDEQHSEPIYEGLMRKSDHKMFFIPKETSREYVLYDFSLQEGDYFDYNYHDKGSDNETHVVRHSVKKVENVNLLGNNTKQIEIASSQSDTIIFDIWYEGIGSKKGLFNTLYMSKSGGGTVFLCAYKNNVLIYDNIHFDRHYYDNAHIEEVDSIFKTKETFEL